MKIVIIDDEREILSVLEKFLVRKGHSVITYDNPIMALSSIREETELVLLDVMMPQMNGLDLYTTPNSQDNFSKILIPS